MRTFDYVRADSAAAAVAAGAAAGARFIAGGTNLIDLMKLNVETPARLLDIVRTHWSVENGLHWALDVTLDEDLARNRKDNAPANLAVLRRLALNVARAHPDTKTSLRRKLLRAGWDNTFLFDLIRHMR